MVAAAGAGPPPIPHKSLNRQNLEQAILFCLKPEVQKAAEMMSMKMKTEHGIGAAVASFHRNLPVQTMCCKILPQYPAAWRQHKVSGTVVRLSRPAAEILVRHSKIDAKSLRR